MMHLILTMTRISRLVTLLVLFVGPAIVASLDGTEDDGTTYDLSPRIVGGWDTAPGEYPFFAQWSGCGASLIWEDILLTAAHCNVISSNLVLVGAYQALTIQSGEINSEVRNIVDRRQHPSWNDETYENDILILKLDKPIYRQMITYNTDASSPTDYETLTVIGLGSTDPRADFNSSDLAIPIILTEKNGTYDRSGDKILQEVDIQLIPNEVCNGDSMFRGFIKTDIMICAGEEQGGKDACSGDSGGPLIRKSTDGTMVQVGIVSFGAGCARANRPGIYTRLSSYTDWIQQQICELSSNPPSSCNGDEMSLQRSANVTSSAPSALQPMRFSSVSPTSMESLAPTINSNSLPSDMPSLTPSLTPSIAPSFAPSMAPSLTPSLAPSLGLTVSPHSDSPIQARKRSPFRRNWQYMLSGEP